MKISTKARNAAISAAVNTALGYLEKDPEHNAIKILDLLDHIMPDHWYEGQRNTASRRLSLMRSGEIWTTG